MGAFHTDARIFNPSFDKDIQLTATFMPTGNQDNTTAQAVSQVTIPKRQMKVLDDVTAQLFNATSTPLGAMRFTSTDDFEVTSRIYARNADGSTLGQFSVGAEPGNARARGALLQLKQNGGPGQLGTFRTNIGAVNPSTGVANVTWTLYDKANNVITTKQMVLQPFGVMQPTAMAASGAGGIFDISGKNADLSDAWVSFSSDVPVLAYGSVVDNFTTDPTWVDAVEDKGNPPAQQQPPPTTNAKSFDVLVHDFEIVFTPDPQTTLKVGDVATFHVRVNNKHDFELVSPSGQILLGPIVANPTGQPQDVTFTVANGTYSYFCINSTCGNAAQHSQMAGDIVIGDGTPPDHGY